MAGMNFTALISKDICKICSISFSRSKNSKGFYCSHACRGLSLRTPIELKQPVSSRIYAGYCATCTNAFVSKRPKRYCATSCQPSAFTEYQYISLMKSVMRCRTCAASYKPLSTGGTPSVYCSNECKCIANRMHKRINKAKRKAVLVSVTIENVDPFKVFDRDKWICQLCGVHTPKRLRGTYEDIAPELDHIVPLSKGGDHSYVNTQCCCRCCNGEKSDKVVGQGRLFGL